MIRGQEMVSSSDLDKEIFTAFVFDCLVSRASERLCPSALRIGKMLAITGMKSPIRPDIIIELPVSQGSILTPYNSKIRLVAQTHLPPSLQTLLPGSSPVAVPQLSQVGRRVLSTK
jgi:hypothetical protein